MGKNYGKNLVKGAPWGGAGEGRDYGGRSSRGVLFWSPWKERRDFGGAEGSCVLSRLLLDEGKMGKGSASEDGERLGRRNDSTWAKSWCSFFSLFLAKGKWGGDVLKLEWVVLSPSSLSGGDCCVGDGEGSLLEADVVLVGAGWVAGFRRE